MPEISVKHYFQPRGPLSWMLTVDHKRIGLLYIVYALVLLVIGGVGSVLLQRFITDFQYTQTQPAFFAFYDGMSLLLVLYPLLIGLFNYLVPLMIGAGTMALPRLQTFGWWCFLWGSLIILFGEYNLQLLSGSPSGTLMLSLSIVCTSLNLLVTIWNLRAPGMSLGRIPLFVWAVIFTCSTWLLVWPLIGLGALLRLMDQLWTMKLYALIQTADFAWSEPLSWKLHPEILVLVVPALSIALTIIPVCSKRLLKGYLFQLGISALIPGMALLAWLMALFTQSDTLNPASALFMLGTFFLLSLQAIAAILHFTRYTFTFNIALFFAIMALVTPVLCGISGAAKFISLGSVQSPSHYYMTSHFHFLIFGTTLNALFAGVYFWFPKIFGKMYDQKMAMLHFVFYSLGFYLMSLSLLSISEVSLSEGYIYPAGWVPPSVQGLVRTGILVSVAANLAGVLNLMRGMRGVAQKEMDPWDGHTLEWSIPSPPPAYNFAVVPQVNARNAFWNLKHTPEGENTPYTPPKASGKVYLTPLSPWPLLLSLGCLGLIGGLALQTWMVVMGVVIILIGCFGNAFQPT
ncbi:cbb3-type cytochrome c oxidase subunit I [Deltaproteobacteria bacterium TL4]